MKYSELNINEFETFPTRNSSVDSDIGYGHGKSIAGRGGSKWQQAQADADREAARRMASATPPGMTAPADPDVPTGANELPEPTGSGGEGRLVANSSMNPLFTLNGQQSTNTRPTAGNVMQNDTLPRARRMAGIFGAPITINDAIAKRGTSRESQTVRSMHFQGRALDISVDNMSNEQKLQLVGAALQAGFTGFGFGNNILHVDTGTRRHWAYGNGSYGGLQIAQLGNMVRSYTPGGTAVA
jgi:hypothetical protein